MKPGQECMIWVCFGKENNSSRRIILKIELELNNLNSILSRSAVTPVFPFNCKAFHRLYSCGSETIHRWSAKRDLDVANMRPALGFFCGQQTPSAHILFSHKEFDMCSWYQDIVETHGILFASAQVVYTTKSDSPLYFVLGNIWQIRSQKWSASAWCLLPAHMLERWPYVCSVKMTFTLLQTNRFVSTTTNSMKYLVPLSIRVCSRNAQPHLK